MSGAESCSESSPSCLQAVNSWRPSPGQQAGHETFPKAIHASVLSRCWSHRTASISQSASQISGVVNMMRWLFQCCSDMLCQVGDGAQPSSVSFSALMPPGQDGTVYGTSSVSRGPLSFASHKYTSGEHWYLVSDDAAELAGSVLSVSACASGAQSNCDERAARITYIAKILEQPVA